MSAFPTSSSSYGETSQEGGWISRGGNIHVLPNFREDMERALEVGIASQEIRGDLESFWKERQGGRVKKRGRIVSKRNETAAEKTARKIQEEESLKRQVAMINHPGYLRRTSTGINYVQFRSTPELMYQRRLPPELPAEEPSSSSTFEDALDIIEAEDQNYHQSQQNQTPVKQWEHQDTPWLPSYYWRFDRRRKENRDKEKFRRKDHETYSGYKKRIIGTHQRRYKKALHKKLAYYGLGNLDKYQKVRRTPIKLEGNRYVDYKGQIRSLSMDPKEASEQWSEEIRKSLK